MKDWIYRDGGAMRMAALRLPFALTRADLRGFYITQRGRGAGGAGREIVMTVKGMTSKGIGGAEARSLRSALQVSF